jgi:anti-sigma factor RsiW
MKCDSGRLHLYVDGGLEGDELAAVEAHLAGCTRCQAELSDLQAQADDTTTWLMALDPVGTEGSDVVAAWTRFRQRPELVPVDAGAEYRMPLTDSVAARWAAWKERIAVPTRTLATGRWRPAAVGLLALTFLIVLVSFAPARQAAAQFLGVFRVRKFAVIPIDPTQVERLESLEQQLDAGLLGEPTVLREPGEPQSVADAAAASAAAGFAVRVPTVLPEGAKLDKFTVETGPAMRMEMDRALAQAMLEAAGVRDVKLPEVDNVIAEVDIPTLALQRYKTATVTFEIAQLPSPAVSMPEGIDPTVLGEAFLQLLGTPPEDARRLAQTIDWTSTFVIPLPTDAAEFREVAVDGVTGVLLEERQGARRGRSALLLWQRDGVVYAASADNVPYSNMVDSAELLRVANSLQ